MTPASISSAALRARKMRSTSARGRARVAAENFLRVGSDFRQDAFVALAKKRNRVGEIQLAMSVFRTQRVEARPQLRQREAINAGIHFANRALLGRGAFFFHDGLHAPFGIAHDAAIIGGIVKFGGENRGGSFAAAVRVEKRGKSFSAQQRRIARNNDRNLRAFANGAPRDLHRVAGAALRLLQNGLRAKSS